MGSGCFTVIGGLLGFVFIIYITVVNPDMQFILATLPLISLTLFTMLSGIATPTRYADQTAVRKK